MTTSYTAIIEEQSRKIVGVDAGGKYLLASDEELWIKPLKKSVARARKLKKVSKLTFTGGEWLLDGENLKCRYFDATTKSHESSGEAHSEAHTTFRLLEVLKEVSDKDRPEINGVAWFDEGFDAIEGETTEMCAVTNDDLDALAGVGNHVKRRPLPPAKGFRPVLLTDFQVSPRHGLHAKSYEAMIDGQKRQVIGFGEQGYLVLADGQRYIFEKLNFNPPGQPPHEPAGDIFGFPLLEVVKLQPCGDGWKWNDEEKLLSQWLEAEGQKIDTEAQKSSNRLQRMNQLAFENTLFVTRSLVKSRLKELPTAIQETVRGVAWFKFDDGMDGIGTPIFLKSFRPLPPSAKPEEAKGEAPNNIVSIGKRLRYTPGFNDVWLDDKLFDLRSRSKARACLQYLVTKKAFDEKTARHLEKKIDPFVRKQSGLPKSADIRIHHYFNTADGRLKKLRDVIKPVGHDGRYYLKLT